MAWLLGLLVLALVLVASFVGIYNNLVNLRNRFKNAFAQIDVQLKRRHDLIPNLVETAKGYMKHERETLEAVIQARNAAVAATDDPKQGPAQVAAAENMLTGALRQLFALSESYPDLKANENFAQLQEELTSTENRVAFARQAFNDAITEFNTSCEKFPANLIAGSFGFHLAELLESTESPEERKPVKVSF